VLLEDPVYPGLREMLHRAGARLAGIPVTAAGLDLSEVNRVLQRERARLIFVTPTFQNPTGATLPRAARAELIRLASARGVTIVENDVYSALRYEGEPIPSVKELASGGEVIQLGSFSRWLFRACGSVGSSGHGRLSSPARRVSSGWICTAITFRKRCCCGSPNPGDWLRIGSAWWRQGQRNWPPR